MKKFFLNDNFNPIRVKHASIHVKRYQYSSHKKLIVKISYKTICSRGQSHNSDFRLQSWKKYFRPHNTEKLTLLRNIENESIVICMWKNTMMLCFLIFSIYLFHFLRYSENFAAESFFLGLIRNAAESPFVFCTSGFANSSREWWSEFGTLGCGDGGGGGGLFIELYNIEK